MKNIRYHMMLAATMFLASCSQDKEFRDFPAPGTQDNLVEITIGAPQANDSRVSYDDTATPFAWEDGDQIITVGFTADGTYKGQQVYSMKDELTEDKKTATFIGQLIEGAEQYKVYYKASQLTISATDGTPKVNYNTQSADLTSAETQTAHMKNFYQLATPKVDLNTLLDIDSPKNLKLENSLLRLDVKSYPTEIGTLDKILLRTNIAKKNGKTTSMSFTNAPSEQKGFKGFMLFDPTEMAQTAGETFEVVFIGDKGVQAISKDNTKATFNNAGSRYNLIAYQNESEIQDASTKAVLNNWNPWEGAKVDEDTHTITTLFAGFITPDMIDKARGTGKEIIVKGDINGHDIKAIREAVGCMYDNSQNPNLKEIPLRSLDLSNAIIKASNDTYANNGIAYHTEDNKIGPYMFQISALQRIKLPKGITEIGDKAFFANFILTSINIPSTVTVLGNSAFKQNENLKSIAVPDNVTSVGTHLFSKCLKLESVRLSENCKEITDQMFRDCGALKSIVIPESITTISFFAFSNTSLESLVIPSGVKTIRQGFIDGVTTLQSLKFKGAGTKLEHAFEAFTGSNNCDLVIPNEWKDKVTVGEDKQSMFEDLVWKSIKTLDELFVDVDTSTHTVKTKNAGTITPFIVAEAMGNSRELIVKGEINGRDIKSIREAAGCMYNNTQNPELTKARLRYLDLSETTIKASDDIFAEDKTIGAYHTEDNKISDRMFTISALVSIKLPEGITEIGYDAFMDNYILEDINIPNSVTTLLGGVFAGCESLKTIVIPDNITSMGNNFFEYCKKLESVKLSINCQKIPAQIFSRCFSLKSITIPETVVSIASEAFKETILESLIIPSEVNLLGANLFEGVETLKSLTIESPSAELKKTFLGFTASENCDLVIPAEW